MFRVGSFLFVLFFGFSSAYSGLKKDGSSSSSPCSFYLSKSYNSSQIFTNKPTTTLAVEPGSLEYTYPGITREIVNIRYEFLELSHSLIEEDKVVRKRVIHSLSQLKYRIYKLLEKYNNDKVGGLFSRLLQRIEHWREEIRENKPLKPRRVENEVYAFKSFLWEAVIACFFEAKEIYLGANVLDIYSEKLKGSPKQLKRIDRELDIVILKSTGDWRWIEVKDWSIDSMLDPKQREKFFSQSKGQSRVKSLLEDMNIKLDIVFKYGMNPSLYSLYRSQSFYDEILFVFPLILEKSNYFHFGEFPDE